jgi:hypothetical protein
LNAENIRKPWNYLHGLLIAAGWQAAVSRKQSAEKQTKF